MNICPDNPLSQVAQLVKNPPANAGDTRHMGSIPGSGRSPGVGSGNPFQYSCPENSMDRGVWRDYSPWGRRELESTEHALAGWWVRGGEILLNIIE